MRESEGYRRRKKTIFYEFRVLYMDTCSRSRPSLTLLTPRTAQPVPRLHSRHATPRHAPHRLYARAQLPSLFHSPVALSGLQPWRCSDGSGCSATRLQPQAGGRLHPHTSASGPALGSGDRGRRRPQESPPGAAAPQGQCSRRCGPRASGMEGREPGTPPRERRPQGAPRARDILAEPGTWKQKHR